MRVFCLLYICLLVAVFSCVLVCFCCVMFGAAGGVFIVRACVSMVCAVCAYARLCFLCLWSDGCGCFCVFVCGISCLFALPVWPARVAFPTCVVCVRDMFVCCVCGDGVGVFVFVCVVVVCACACLWWFMIVCAVVFDCLCGCFCVCVCVCVFFLGGGRVCMLVCVLCLSVLIGCAFV